MTAANTDNKNMFTRVCNECKNKSCDNCLKIINRPDGYWLKLFKTQKCLITNIKDTIMINPNLYVKILSRWCEQCEWAEYVLSVDPKKHWILWKDNDDEEEGIKVVQHKKAQHILNDWHEFESLGKNVPTTVETFDDLMIMMSKFNPYWILEMAALILQTDFSRCSPNEDFDYTCDESDIILIKEKLQKEISK